MNLEYVRLKKYFSKKLKGEVNELEDISVDRKIAVVNDQILFLFARMSNDEVNDEESQINTLKCLSKFIRHQNVKDFLFDRVRKTKFENLKKEIRNLYDGKLDTKDIDETISIVKKNYEMRKKALEKIGDL